MASAHQPPEHGEPGREWSIPDAPHLDSAGYPPVEPRDRAQSAKQEGPEAWLAKYSGVLPFPTHYIKSSNILPQTNSPSEPSS